MIPRPKKTEWLLVPIPLLLLAVWYSPDSTSAQLHESHTPRSRPRADVAFQTQLSPDDARPYEPSAKSGPEHVVVGTKSHSAAASKKMVLAAAPPGELTRINHASEISAFDSKAAPAPSVTRETGTHRRDDVLVPAWVWFEMVSAAAQAPGAQHSRTDDSTQSEVGAEPTTDDEPIRRANTAAPVEPSSGEAASATRLLAQDSGPRGAAPSLRSAASSRRQSGERPTMSFLTPITPTAATSKSPPPTTMPIAKPAAPRAAGKPKTDPARTSQAANHTPEVPKPAWPQRYLSDDSTTIPLPLDDGSLPYWSMRNAENAKVADTGQHAPVLFLGDSITDLLSTGAGQPAWHSFLAPLGAVNFAVGGAFTSNVLWQIEMGQVTAVRPDVIVLQIGTNNLGAGHSPAATAAGITKVVNELQKQLPNSRILLVGILPRGANANDPFRAKIAQVNRQISALNDSDAVRFLNVGTRLLDEDGSLSPRVMPDFLHPSLLGYIEYLSAIVPTLGAMLDKQ